MVEVTVESIRVSLINQNRLVVLREKRSPRYLSIWIGAFEADAITVGLQDDEVPRPLTHDLICNILTQLGAELEQIEILDMRDDTFFSSAYGSSAQSAVMKSLVVTARSATTFS